MQTIVSAMPFELTEYKPGLNPSTYVMPAAEGDNVQVLHVEDAVYPVYIGDGRNLQQVERAEVIANSVINDFVSAQLVHETDAKPALFVLDGKVTAEEVKTKHLTKLKTAQALQKAWFWKLVQLADDDWQKYRQHRMITDHQRMAARALGLKKDWLYTIADMQDCPGCGSKVLQNIAVCPNCRAILDEKKAAELKFAAVK